jgi:hypothetical protein
VREVDREGHQRRRLVGGVAEHHPLVTRTLEVVRVLVLAELSALVRRVDTLSDVGRLGVDGDGDAAGRAIEARARAVVPDVDERGANLGGDVDVGVTS